MKKVTIAASCLLAALVIAIPAHADDRNRNRDRDRDYDSYHGYKERPNEKSRHYRRYDNRGHKYNYRGHWRSWNDFDRHVQRYPYLRRHGRYYRDGAHLIFRTCPPDTATCFFFSIGR